jgi:hypothetical protein
LEVQTKKNSRNSSKPPSSDPPFSKQKRKQKKSKRRKGGQKGHKGFQQEVLNPTKTYWLEPERCTCGNSIFDAQQMQSFYVHQHIELPRIEMEVSHFILQQCDCPNCGKTVKARVPSEKATGYGPRLTAFVAELSGIKAMSRSDVKLLCESVLDVNDRLNGASDDRRNGAISKWPKSGSQSGSKRWIFTPFHFAVLVDFGPVDFVVLAMGRCER